MEGVSSLTTTAVSGVNQNTVLGHLFFLIYRNKIPIYVSPGAQLKLFADDSAIYRKNTLKKILKTEITEKGNGQYTFIHENAYSSLSRTKTSSPFNYKIHNTSIHSTTDARFLGITINNTFSWNTHIYNLCQKGTNTLKILCTRTLELLDPESKINYTKHLL